MFPPQSTVEITSPFDFLGILTLLIVVLHRERVLANACAHFVSANHLVLTIRVPQFSLSLMNGAGGLSYSATFAGSVFSQWKKTAPCPTGVCSEGLSGIPASRHPGRTNCPVALPRKDFRFGGEQMFNLPLRGAPPSGLLLLVCFEIHPGPLVSEACTLAPSCISGPSFRFSYFFLDNSLEQAISPGGQIWHTISLYVLPCSPRSSLNSVLLK